MYVANVVMKHQNGLGNVHGCNSWNTCYEEKTSKNTSKNKSNNKNSIPVLLNEVKNQNIIRRKTGFNELDRVLG